MLEGLEGDSRIKQCKELLSDVCILWGTRWSIDFSWHTSEGVMYVYGMCGRFPISTITLERALGDLSTHIQFHRGGAHDSWEALVRYRSCLKRWNVPDTVTESTSGEGHQEKTSGTFWQAKKTRR